MTAQVGDTASSDTPLGKSEWRRLMRQRRAALDRTARRQAAEQSARHLIRALRQRGARSVAVYVAYGAELSTDALIAQLHRAGMRVAVPRLRASNAMVFVELRPGAVLRHNRYGIAEPAGRACHARVAELDAIVLPLTAFDVQGHRLGTGGGYYDRLLADRHSRRRPWRVGYAYSFQQAQQLPVEPWDIRLHAVCTERGLRRFD
jgi:5-formyltetrahydrofolate cyclo-ligase